MWGSFWSVPLVTWAHFGFWFIPFYVIGKSYQFSNDVEFKLATFLQLIGTIKRAIFKKMRTETILKIYNTLVLPAFYMGQKIGL